MLIKKQKKKKLSTAVCNGTVSASLGALQKKNSEKLIKVGMKGKN